MFENPPYFSGNRNASALVVNSASGADGKKRSLKSREKSWVSQRMQKEGFKAGALDNTVREFIWSAYTDYLRQDGDSLIVYSPVAYFKGYHLQDKMLKLKYKRGFGFNRKHFHASNALVSCVKWDYESSYNSVATEQKEFLLELLDINKHKQLEHLPEQESLEIKKTYTSPNFYFKDKNQKNAFAVLSNNGSAPKTGLGLLRSIAEKTGRNDEIYLNEQNFYNLLPIYIAQLTFDRQRWYNNDNTLRSADRKNDYLRSEELLRRSLLFSCLYQNSHCATMRDSAGKLVKNELCFDDNTVASKKLEQLEKAGKLDGKDKEILKSWCKVLRLARATPEYKANYKYGSRQIMQELDTYELIPRGLKFEKKYKNIDLHNNLMQLNKKVKEYYLRLIEPLLFEYELIK